jgi:hypothetical protein
MVFDEAAGIPLVTQDGHNLGESAAPTSQPERRQARYLIVVSRDQPDLWRHLRQMLTGVDGIQVVLDRRHGGRWQWSQSRGYEERGTDRRRPPSSQTGFAQRSFVIVDPEDPGTSRPRV